MLDAGGLGVHLAEEVQVHDVVDGDELVKLGDDAHVVGVVHGGAHDVGVAVDVVIQLLGAGGEGEDLAAIVHGLVLAVDLAGLGDVHEGVHVHLGVHAQVLQVGLGDQGAHGVGHAADAQLQAGAVGDLGDDQVGHGAVHVGGGHGAQLGDLGVGALDHHGHVLDVHLGLMQAVDIGHILVDFHDDALGPGHHVIAVGGSQGEVEVAVLVHGGRLEHDHVHGVQVLAVEPGQLGVAHGGEPAHALADDLPVDAGAVPGVPGEVVAGVVGLGDLGHPHGHAAADLHVLQLILAGGQGDVQVIGVVGAPGVVHPVAGLDHLHGLGGGGQLALVQCLKIHSSFLLCSQRLG